MPYDVEAARKAARALKSQMDPNEFRPPKAEDGKNLVFRFYVLPPLMEGDKCADSVCGRTMELPCIMHGTHWLNKQPLGCPRVSSDGTCEHCDTGFSMMRETKNKKERSDIAKAWLAQTNYMANIYFPRLKSNPEELHGKILYYNAPKTVFDLWNEALFRDDKGDPADPKAFGAFFDERHAFLFQLECEKSGEYNSYKKSKFLANIAPHAIAMKSDKTPDEEAIKAILEKRHNLWTKMQQPDLDALHKRVAFMLHGVPLEEGAAPDLNIDELAGAGAVIEPPPEGPVVGTQGTALPQAPAPAVATPAKPPKPTTPTPAAPTPAPKPTPPKPAAPKPAPPAPAPAPATAPATAPAAPVAPAAPAAPAAPEVDGLEGDELNELLEQLNSNEFS
jgi:hypothetical protein